MIELIITAFIAHAIVDLLYEGVERVKEARPNQLYEVRTQYGKRDKS